MAALRDAVRSTVAADPPWAVASAPAMHMRFGSTAFCSAGVVQSAPKPHMLAHVEALQHEHSQSAAAASNQGQEQKRILPHRTKSCTARLSGDTQPQSGPTIPPQRQRASRSSPSNSLPIRALSSSRASTDLSPRVQVVERAARMPLPAHLPQPTAAAAALHLIPGESATAVSAVNCLDAAVAVLTSRPSIAALLKTANSMRPMTPSSSLDLFTSKQSKLVRSDIWPDEHCARACSNSRSYTQTWLRSQSSGASPQTTNTSALQTPPGAVGFLRAAAATRSGVLCYNLQACHM